MTILIAVLVLVLAYAIWWVAGELLALQATSVRLLHSIDKTLGHFGSSVRSMEDDLKDLRKQLEEMHCPCADCESDREERLKQFRNETEEPLFTSESKSSSGSNLP